MLELGQSVVLDIFKKLEKWYCKLYFKNFFNSPALVVKLFDKRIYCIGTVRTDRKNMIVMNTMERVDIDFEYADQIAAMKWYDNSKFVVRFHLLVTV